MATKRGAAEMRWPQDASMRMAMVMAGRADLFWLGWRAATVGGLASGGLELDGGVGDVEAVMEPAVDLCEDA
jgi:hypothetical protein